jgi:hypothetical protein
MGWAGWLVGGGMVANILGEVLKLFKGSDGGAKKKETTVDITTLKSDVNGLAKYYSDKTNTVSASVQSDGTILATINGKKEIFKTKAEFEARLGELESSPEGAGGVTTTSIEEQVKGAEITVQGINTKYHAKVVDGKIKYYSDDDQNTTYDKITDLTNATTTQNNNDTKKAEFGKLFNEAYINVNFQTSGNNTGKLKVGETYYDDVDKAYNAYIKEKQGGTNAEIAKNPTLSTVFANNSTLSVIDDSDIGDLLDKAVSGYNSTNSTVQIGGRNYSIENKDGYIYLTDKTAGNNNKQVYILEKVTQNGTTSYQIVQRKDIAFVDSTGGWNKAATKKKTS